MTRVVQDPAAGGTWPAAGRGAPAARLLSVIVPVFNECAVLPAFHQRLYAVLAGLSMRFEILYVDDGSTDGTASLLEGWIHGDDQVGSLVLSRNFGKEIALAAGLDVATGDAVVVIDADLQDPPELIPKLVEQWQAGYDVVYARRISRRGESVLKRLTAFAFYRIVRRAGRVEIPPDVGDFRLLSRRAVEALKRLREHHRFTKGLFAWIGFPQIGVPYQRGKRAAGASKWSYWRLWNFAIEGVTSFSTAPLRMATYMGLATALAAFAYALVVIYRTLAYGDPARGYPSLMVVILFLGGVQLITLGIIGEYLGRMFGETKNRPLYLIRDFHPPGRRGTEPVALAVSEAGASREALRDPS